MSSNIQEPVLGMPYGVLLSADEQEQLAGKISIVRFGARDIIFKQNTRTSHIIFIRSGLVKISKEGRNDRSYILKLAGSGEFIGLMSAFGNDHHQYSAIALENTEIGMIDIEIFKDIIQHNGRYAVKIINLISKHGLFVFDKLLSQVHKQLPGRIADVILYFSEVIYKSNSFTFPLTRKELAELAGTTKESFIRTLTEFRNDKIIELEGSKLTIISIDIIKTLHLLG